MDSLLFILIALGIIVVWHVAIQAVTAWHNIKIAEDLTFRETRNVTLNQERENNAS